MANEVYTPPYSLNNSIINLVAGISEMLVSIEVTDQMNVNPQLRRDNRIKTVHSSLAIENNTLSLDQVTAILDGKRVLGPPSEIKEVENAFEAYNHLLSFDPYSITDLLEAHRFLMRDLVREAGVFRTGGVGVFGGDKVIHMAPPARLVHAQIANLLDWVGRTDAHPLVKSCVFHYEFEFIHPFADGNGRMGRMWQTLLLYQWIKIFAWLPVETIIKARQTEYYDAIAVSTKENNSQLFIEFLLQAVFDTLKEMLETAQADAQVTAQVALLLAKLGNETLSAKELMARVGLKHRQNFQKNYLAPALSLKKIEMTQPDKPTSGRQRYRKVD